MAGVFLCIDNFLSTVWQRAAAFAI